MEACIVWRKTLPFAGLSGCPCTLGICRRQEPVWRNSMLDDSKYTSVLAIVVVVAVPVIGVWELLRQDEPPSLRTFRLLVVLACGLFLAVVALLAEQLNKAGFRRDAKKLEALNRELVEA